MNDTEYAAHVAKTIHDLRAEVEQLRAENEKLRGHIYASNRPQPEEVEWFRVENEKLRALVRAAYQAGYWEWCGPANEEELERAQKEELEGWEKWWASIVAIETKRETP